MSGPILVFADILAARVHGALTEAGADAASAEATTRALMHASRIGVDSHGVRLAEHYATMLRGGRINGAPTLSSRRTAAATAVLDGDDGLGHLVGARAMTLAVEIAREAGVGAVGVVRSSHFGAAGAYAILAAEAGMIGFATTNSDSIVAPFEGAQALHGTNPLAFAAPVEGGKPWLFDMATSSIPFNRVLLYRSLGSVLPANVAADASGVMTRDPAAAAMLMPAGGAEYGFKGAGLAGVATLFSAVLTGTTLDQAMLPMGGPEIATPRGLGHFFLAVDPVRFAGATAFAAGMRAYLEALRGVSSTVEGGAVLAPGDREWRVETERLRDGIPVDPDTARFLGLL